MNKRKIPDWLVETQNKSWEPEILISGITLTVLFVLTNYIYNFYGMLIQDFGVTYVIPNILYIISIIILTGLKIVLIIHLILRGVWTGFVGLSYVFPHGVRREKLPKSDRKVRFIKPEAIVIKLERVCSLLFSFIFTTIALSLSFYLLYIPIILVFMIGLNRKIINVVTLVYILGVIIAVLIVALLFKTRLKDSNLKNRVSNNLYQLTLNIYFTNIGRVKTYVIFTVYFLLIILISYSDLTKFKFENEKGMELNQESGIVQLNYDHYEDIRNRKLRISKATINQFRVTEKNLKLFISYYKRDIHAVRNIKKKPELLKEKGFESTSARITLQDLYRIKIDKKIVSGLRWYELNNQYTHQKGLFTHIPLDTFKNGYHEIKIDKLILRFRKKKLKLIKNWLIIPFELESF